MEQEPIANSTEYVNGVGDPTSENRVSRKWPLKVRNSLISAANSKMDLD